LLFKKISRPEEKVSGTPLTFCPDSFGTFLLFINPSNQKSLHISTLQKIYFWPTTCIMSLTADGKIRDKFRKEIPQKKQPRPGQPE